MPVIRFLLLFTGLAVLVYGAGFLLQACFPDRILLSPAFPVLVGFLFLLTGLIFVLSCLGIKRSPETGVFALLGGSVLKMLFALIFIFFMFRKYSENQIVLALNFFSIYFLFTIFEVTVLLRILRDQNKT